MIRGTTARYKIKLPCLKKDLDFATIKFWQSNNPNKRLPIIKRINDCGGSDELPELCVSLSAEETARFSDKYKAKLQWRASYNGNIFGNKGIKLLTVYPMPDDIIETEPTAPVESEFIVLEGQDIGQLSDDGMLIIFDGQDIGTQSLEDNTWVVIDGQEVVTQGGGANG